MGGRGSSGRPLSTPPPASAGPSADLRDLDHADLRDQLRDLRDAAEDRDLTAAEQAHLTALTLEDAYRRDVQKAAADVTDTARQIEDHDAWRSEHGPDTPTQARLRQVLIDLTAALDPAGLNDAVFLSDVRAALPDLSRADVDHALMSLLDDPDIWVAPETDQRRLTPARRAAAIQIGGKPKDLVRARDSRVDAARARERAAALAARHANPGKDTPQ